MSVPQCGREGEGEQLQQVERRHDARAEAAEGRRCVDQQGRRQGAQTGSGFRGWQQQQLTVGGENCGAAVRRLRRRARRAAQCAPWIPGG